MSNGNNINIDKTLKTDEVLSTEKTRVEISDRHQLFAALFLGLVNPLSEHPNSLNKTVKAYQQPTNEASENHNSIAAKQDSLEKMHSESDSSHASLNDPIDGVLNQIEKLIPHDPTVLRETSVFKGTLQLLQWQRDNYLVGGEYADWRRDDRIREQRFPAPQKPWYRYALPYDGTALSHDQISSVASAFIPMKTVQDLLTPIVTGLFDTKTGVLFGPIRDSAVNLIVDQQKLLEETVKDQVLTFLDSPRNRDAMKVSTEGMIIQTTRINKETG
jgi:hypothetical protein